RVAVAFFGEGASSRGDVHEAMNFAGIYKLPVVFVCENNFYAYSTPNELQFAVEDVADRGPGYGFKGEVCSGNDLHAVMKAAKKAIDRARGGEGPTFLECKTYRYHGHSEHDGASYRSEEELVTWESRDPVERWEVYLGKRKYDLAAIRAETGERVKRIVDEALAFAEASPWPEGREAMEDLYSRRIRCL
ncbi:MAG: putative 2-oxoisovalerate dehydrogenase, alpha subunit (TPP-binding module), partial [Actinobacteria bacterium]|nr:putative 2-oxoisovalerate dehydrogenase, alpha subunit (TPP-binding module) [Actinomycetota bacterium]